MVNLDSSGSSEGAEGAEESDAPVWTRTPRGGRGAKPKEGVGLVLFFWLPILFQDFKRLILQRSFSNNVWAEFEGSLSQLDFQFLLKAKLTPNLPSITRGPLREN